jgi:hypothetical protein
MRSFFWVIFWFSFFGFPQIYFAQNQKFSDSLEAYSGYLGFAEFDWVKRNNLKNGNFTFFYNAQDTVESTYTRKILVTGQYKNGLKSNDWSFAHKLFRPSSIPLVDGYSLIHKSSGVEHVILVPFNNGNAFGDAVVTTNQIENSELTKNLFTARTRLENNAFIGKFEAFSDSIRITGEVDQDGLFTNTWIFQHTNGEEITEKRYYDKGVLVGHEIVRNGKTYEILHVGLSKNPEDEGEWVSINADIHYFNILLRTNMGKKAEVRNQLLTDSIISKSNLFLKYSLTSFREFNGLNFWKIDGDETHIYLPKLRVRKFPYTDDERALIKKAREQINEAKSIIKEYIEDPQVELNKHAYRELALYYQIYTEYRDELVKLEKVFHLLNLPSYEFLNRAEIMPLIFDDISYPELVKFKYQDNDSEEKVTFPPNMKVEEATIQNLAAHASEILKGLKTKMELVKPIIDRNRKRFEIVAKEQELLQKRDTIKHLFTNGNKDEKFNVLHERFAAVFIQNAEEIFVNYAKQEIENRIALTDETMLCLDEFINAYAELIKTQARLDRIDEVYTRVVWNPFTFTDMTETVKERLFNAYKNDLLPYLLEDIGQNAACNSLAIRLKNMEVLYNKMRDLREEDTKELERALRRIRDPKRIIELLSLTLELS